MHVDLLLRGGTVHDGLGSPGRVADVAVSQGRIASIGRFEGSAAEVVDCDGLIVAPGFIDPHAHSDLVHTAAEPQCFKLAQGVTTEIVGNCGFSFAPVDSAALALLGETWSELGGLGELRERSFAGYLDELERVGPANHVAALVGHNTLRATANGMERELRPGALARMRALAAEAFEAGAVGFSSGLIYVPGSYSDTGEVVAVAEVAAQYGRPYTTHMRDEGINVTDALDEAIAVGRRAGVGVQVSHCKVAGQRNHGRAGELLDRIAAGRREGLDVLGDQYPYTAGSTFLSALLPPAAQEGGVAAMRRRLEDPRSRHELWQLTQAGGAGSGIWAEAEPHGVLVVAHRDESKVARRLDDIAGPGGDAWDALCDLVLADPGAMIVVDLMAEDDVRRIMADPLIAVGSDNGPPVGLQHPRTWGCFPRVLGTYVRELGVLTWEQAIRKMTSLSARAFGLDGRGRLLPGMVADICVFDPQRIGHSGTYVQPNVAPDGVELVALCGRVALRSGVATGERCGRVLRAGRD